MHDSTFSRTSEPGDSRVSRDTHSSFPSPTSHTFFSSSLNAHPQDIYSYSPSLPSSSPYYPKPQNSSAQESHTVLLEYHAQLACQLQAQLQSMLDDYRVNVFRPRDYYGVRPAWGHNLGCVDDYNDTQSYH